MNKKRIKWLLSLALAGTAIIFVLVYFEPQSALINNKTDQAQKGTIVSRATTPTSAVENSENIEPTSEPADIAISTWVSRAHTTSGEVFLTQDENGKTFVRFENLDTTNGPDLKVYLAKALGENGSPIDYVDLGNLIANKGNANYEIPKSVDIGDYSHVVIWCKRFSVSFADAAI